MVRLVNVVIPKDNFPIVNEVIRALSQALYVFQVTNYSSQDFEHFNFKTKDKHLQYVLTQLQSYGCGVHYGIVDVLTLVLSKPPIQFKLQPAYHTDESLYHRTQSEYGEHLERQQQDLEKQPPPPPRHDPMDSPMASPRLPPRPKQSQPLAQVLAVAESSDDDENAPRLTKAVPRVTLTADKNHTPSSDGKKKYRISERMTIDEISIKIDEGNHLTFNYIALLACASVIAGAGLISNSATTIIASMLVSPLMGPILSITFGLAVADRRTIKKGLRNLIYGVAIAFVLGMAIGLIAALIYDPDFRSAEMEQRGRGRNLIFGFIAAVGAGIAVVIAMTSGGANAVVGSAISASLLPPIVNSGMCFVMALKYKYSNGATHDATHFATVGGVSISLFVMNFVCITIFGFSTFRFVKKVSPQEVDQQKFLRTNNGSMYSKRELWEHDYSAGVSSINSNYSNSNRKELQKPLVNNSHHGGSGSTKPTDGESSLSKLSRKSILKVSNNYGGENQGSSSYSPPTISPGNSNSGFNATMTSSPMYDDDKNL